MRFLWLLVVVLVVGVLPTREARASGTVPAGTGYCTLDAGGGYCTSPYEPSEDAACAANAAHTNGQYTESWDGGNPGGCTVTNAQSGTYFTWLAILARAGSSCPGNSTAVNGSCSCSSGFVPDSSGTSCISSAAYCGGVAGGLSGTYYASSSTSPTQNFCSGGCVIESGLSGTDSSGTYFTGPFSSTGATCSGSSAGGAPSPTPLNPGNCPGTVNGVAVPGGVPCGSTTSGSSTSTTPGPSSSESAPAGASNGTSSSSQTTCSGGNCTTTTSTTTTTGVGSAGGGTSTTGSSSTTQSQASFCQANPLDPQCAGESSFGGTCSAGFSCKGDAVACATAQVEYQSTCLFNASPSSATTATYGSLKSQDGKTAQGAFTSNMTVASVLPAPPSAVCAVQDVVIPFGLGPFATSLVVPLGTDLCPNLSLIRTVIVAFGSLLFILIVFVRN